MLSSPLTEMLVVPAHHWPVLLSLSLPLTSGSLWQCDGSAGSPNQITLRPLQLPFQPFSAEDTQMPSGFPSGLSDQTVMSGFTHHYYLSQL